MSATVRVAVCQLSSELGTEEVDPRPANLRKALDYLERAHRAGASLVALGEVFLTGYRSDEYLARYATVLDNADESIIVLRKACEAFDLEVIIGAATRVESVSKPFNSALLIGPDGLRGVYHKTHLGDLIYGENQEFVESTRFAAGSTIPVLTTRLGPTGIQICRDNRFPEVARVQALKGALVLVNISGPLSYFDHFWSASILTRAMENQVWYIFAPIVGVQKGDVYGVSARVISPRGEIVAMADGVDEQMIIADIDVELSRIEQQRANVFGTRRVEVYGDLAETPRTTA